MKFSEWRRRRRQNEGNIVIGSSGSPDAGERCQQLERGLASVRAFLLDPDLPESDSLERVREELEDLDPASPDHQVESLERVGPMTVSERLLSVTESYARMKVARSDALRRLAATEAENTELKAKLEQVSSFTLFPNDDPNMAHLAITVDRVSWPGTFARAFHPHPNGDWAIRRLKRRFNRDGEWEWEPQPSSRDDTFYARTCFTRDEALACARSALHPDKEEAQ